MLEFYYIKALTTIMLDEKISDKIRERKFTALNQINAMMRQFLKEHLLEKLVLAAAEKKLSLLEKAETIAEIAEVEKASLPKYDGNALVGNGPYHVEEEELLWFSIVTPHANLNNYAAERQMKLFRKFLPEYNL